MAAEDLQAKIINSTRLEIDPDTLLEVRQHADDIDPSQFTAGPGDDTPLATAEFLYTQQSDIAEDLSVVDTGIIPRPKSVTSKVGRLSIAEGFTVKGPAAARQAATGAIEHLQDLGVAVGDGGASLTLIIEPDVDKPSGTYRLFVKDDGVRVVGVDFDGVYNGVQSLASLVSLGNTSIPLVTVADEPRYPFRGMHIDVARNFHSKAFVLDLIKQMGAYKLNKLHLHLGDDEGWRLEINDLPELTDIGSRRCHDPEENTCLLMQLGSGLNNSEVDGYYSIEDYIEILTEANKHHIQVIPSFDMPGHSRALIVAMEARYRNLMAAGQQEEAERYRLIDPEDTTVYESIQYYSDNTINVCIPSTYDFISKVMDEMKVVHEQAGQPLTVYHIGADETAGAWVESPKCQAYMQEHNIAEAKDLGGYFVQRISNLLEEKGIKAAGWNDGMGHTDFAKMPDVVQSNIWDVLPWAGVNNLNKQVNHGWDVVLSTPDALYFDFPYEAHPKEPGYYWASRRINTQKVFGFMPDNLPVLAEVWKGPTEKPFSINDTVQRNEDGVITHQPIMQGKRVLGIQGQIWSETLRSDNWTEYQIYPRLLALAERAWHEAEWEVPYNREGDVYGPETNYFDEVAQALQMQDWERFANIVSQKALPKLDKKGVFYRVPTPGAVVENKNLKMNAAFPGLPMEYKVDNGEWTAYSQPVTIEGKEVAVRAMTTDGKRKSRSLVVTVN